MTHRLRTIARAGLALSAALLLAACASQPTEGPAEEPSAMEQDARMAIKDAAAAISKAEDASDGAVPSDETRELLDQARTQADEGEFETAIDSANQAKDQANEELAAWREEQEAAQAKKAEPVSQSVANGTLTAAPDADRGTYRVGRGDSLWDIAAADAIYGDPFAWPLIYKHNSGKIDDADLIYPDQELMIRWDVGSAAMDAAVRHAKTRGAWSLGEVEAADSEYLQQN